MPPKRTVVTLAEKKARILRFFQDGHDIYSIKDLEKYIPKRCAGVTSMLVKELVQQLIDEDGIISVEKCGNVNVYWCFKNQLMGKMYVEMKQYKAKIDQSQEKIKELQSELDDQKQDKRSATFVHGGKNYKRAKLVKENEELGKQLTQVQTAYKKVAQVKWDDNKIKQHSEYLKRKLEQLDQITDNIELIISFLMRKHGVRRADLAASMDMPEEFEEFEEIRKSIV
ncbi:Mnd1p Ecym_8402 [Eremothecium cymbalariae DBVPG|uniref:Meiotic nuclear division protein 1 n=1 Tax=Eremothecium cymbalariae (strain CBS 270.75 / DBVPG 7215 / KCTC 17166 / NRRL Y-17582) TaxID=931890 RepID=G8JXU8_ERECY|nr:Hypothetical protein Ecym_8402 [Eremothecium cymbalariae DBVPG\